MKPDFRRYESLKADIERLKSHLLEGVHLWLIFEDPAFIQALKQLCENEADSIVPKVFATMEAELERERKLIVDEAAKLATA